MVLSCVPALIRSALLKKSFEMRAGGCDRSFTLLHFQRKFSFREQLERPTISRNSSLISYRSDELTETRSASVGGTIFLQREKEKERERERERESLLWRKRFASASERPPGENGECING